MVFCELSEVGKYLSVCEILVDDKDVGLGLVGMNGKDG